MANTTINTPSLLDLGSSTEATILPKGTTSERPPSANSVNIDYLVVAGGGGGGTALTASTIGTGGGGGAGGLRTSYGSTSGGGASAESSLSLLVATSYTVTIGEGGSGGVSASSVPTNGEDSVFSSITSVGGGAGGNYRNPTSSSYYAQIGGSGGGAAYTGGLQPGAAGTTGQGYAGGDDLGNSGSPAYGHGGGGGAAAVGVNGGGSGSGAGGAGLAVSIAGSSVTYGGGGGGGGVSPYPAGAGGAGGGGAGGLGNGNAGVAGSSNTGGGGGGGGKTSASGTLPGNGANGGSGIVILRYASTINLTVVSGLTTSVLNGTVSGSTDKYTIFTSGTGTITFANSYSGPTVTEGDFRFNTETNKLEFYNGTEWREIVDEYAGIVATNYFDTKLYAGNGGTQSVGLNFQPDFVWIKSRTANAYPNNVLQDSVRGANQYLISDGAFIQSTNSTFGSFDANPAGFTLTSGNVTWNASGSNYVSWDWKAGGAPTATNAASAGAVPTSGSVMIDGVASTATLAGTIAAKKISTNTAAGFSIVKYTGNGGSTAKTVGHGLLYAPEIIISKDLDSSSYDWAVYTSATGNTKKLALNQSNAQVTSGVWNDTSPTNSVFSVRYDQTNATGNDFIAYCWHSVAGYSKIGTYAGNSSTNKITLDFAPSWVMIKLYDITGGNWFIYDNKRNPSNPADLQLEADTTAADTDHGAVYELDFLSDGFELLGAGGAVNYSGRNYLYMAFA